MKRPQKIRIFGKVFNIRYIPSGGEPFVGDRKDDYGECDVDNQDIVVRDGQPLETEQDTVFHEIFHAVDGSMVDEEQMIDEAVVRRMATGLLAVFKDNPRLLSYLRASPRPKAVVESQKAPDKSADPAVQS